MNTWSPPARDWAAALEEYRRGICVRLTFTTTTGDVIVSETNSFMRARAAVPLTDMEKRAVDLALVQIGRGQMHPALSPKSVPLNPDAFMASPAPGVTMTWRPHQTEPSLPVMLTLHVDRA